MNSPSRASWVSGIAIGVVSLGHSLFRILVTAAAPADQLPAALLAFISNIAVTLVLAGEVRLGLHLARCPGLNRAAMLAIPGTLVGILAVANFIPVKTHAVRVDLPVPGGPFVPPPLLPIAVTLIVIILPCAVAYIVGRTQRPKRGVA